MSSYLLCIVFIAFRALPAAAQLAGQTYASIKPASYGVNLTFSGVTVPQPQPCLQSAPGSPCLPQIVAGSSDAVIISYGVNTSAPVNSTATITLKACYGPQSYTDRAWRKPSPIITSDNSCNVKIASGLPPQGNFTYTPGPNTPPAVYQVLVLEICQGGAACGMGMSSGFYQVQAIDSRPAWLMAIMGVFSIIGPLSLAGFFVWEQYYKKQR